SFCAVKIRKSREHAARAWEGRMADEHCPPCGSVIARPDTTGAQCGQGLTGRALLSAYEVQQQTVTAAPSNVVVEVREGWRGTARHDRRECERRSGSAEDGARRGGLNFD